MRTSSRPTARSSSTGWFRRRARRPSPTTRSAASSCSSPTPNADIHRGVISLYRSPSPSSAPNNSRCEPERPNVQAQRRYLVLSRSNPGSAASGDTFKNNSASPAPTPGKPSLIPLKLLRAKHQREIPSAGRDGAGGEIADPSIVGRGAGRVQASTAGTGRRSDEGSFGPRPKRTTRSGRRFPTPRNPANCGRSVDTSTG